MYYLMGGAGYCNFGDELMVRCWIDRFASGAAGVVIDGYNRENLSKTFGSKYEQVVYSDLANTLSELGEPDNFWDAAMRGATFFDRGGFGDSPDRRDFARYLQDASVLHLHGGGYLNNHFRKKGFLLGLAAAVADQTGAKLVGTGLGLMPMDAPPGAIRDDARRWFERFDLIETRDRESAQLVRELAPRARVVAGLDDTFLGHVGYRDDGLHRLHLSWSEERVDAPEFGRVVDYVAKNHHRYDEVTFWQCAPNDAGAWDHLSAQFPEMTRLDFGALVGGDIPLAPGDHMLTARFHPHLIGARGGAAGGHYTPGDYYDVKHRSVRAIGSGFFQIGDDEIKPGHFDAEANRLRGRLDDLLSQKDGIYADVYEH